MKTIIRIEPPEWSKVEHDKPCVTMEFCDWARPDGKGNYKWMPTYKELKRLMDFHGYVEEHSWGNKDVDKLKGDC